MRIEIDRFENHDGIVEARVILHTERTDWNKVQDPRDATKTMDVADFLLLINGDKVAQEKAGYLVSRQFKGEDAPKTAWQRIVEASNHSDADVDIKGKLR